MAPNPFLFISSPLDLAPDNPTSQQQALPLPIHEQVEPWSPESPSKSTPPPLFTQEEVVNPRTLRIIKRGSLSSISRGPGGGGVEKRTLSLEPDSTQKVTLGVIAVYVVVIAILWHVPVLNYVLYPFKMLTIAFHEFGHAITGVCTGAHIKSIDLDPNEGGVTKMSGGISAITLPAGYLGSSLIGALLIFCGFDIVASKVASLALGVAFLITLWWGRRSWLTIITILFAVGTIIAFWFIAHAEPLRFLVLFMGVMSALYSAWDIMDDLILRKVNESDASVFAKRYGGSSKFWGVIWCIVSILFMACGIIAGLAFFKESFSQQEADSSKFIPTM